MHYSVLTCINMYYSCTQTPQQSPCVNLTLKILSLQCTSNLITHQSFISSLSFFFKILNNLSYTRYNYSCSELVKSCLGHTYHGQNAFCFCKQLERTKNPTPQQPILKNVTTQWTQWIAINIETHMKLDLWMTYLREEVKTDQNWNWSMLKWKGWAYLSEKE